MAGHDFMDFRYTADGLSTGGSDGCINLDEPDNTGLPQCLTHFDFTYEYQSHCDTVSLADFFVLLAEAAVSRVATKWGEQEPFSDGTLE